MHDPTINPSDSQSLNLHNDTEIYLCVSPRVRVFEIDVFDNTGSILNFRQSGLRIAREMIRRQGGEDVSIPLTHDKFAEALWPDLAPDARIRKFTRGLKNLREDMEASNFYFIYPRKQKPKLTEDGFEGQPTLYEPGDYWRLSNALQDRAKEVDFFAFPADRRRAKERAELKAILREFKCVRITRRKKDEQIKPAKPSLPCRCACANCATCAAKAPAVEPEKKAEIRITKESVEDRLHSLVDAIYDCGVDWMNLDLEHSAFAGKLVRDFDEVVMRLREGVKRHNTPRKLKLVGGQAK